jgi:hypothetical protein
MVGLHLAEVVLLHQAKVVLLQAEVVPLQAEAVPNLLLPLLGCLQCDLEVRLAVVVNSLNYLLRLGGTVLGLLFRFLHAACI